MEEFAAPRAQGSASFNIFETDRYVKTVSEPGVPI